MDLTLMENDCWEKNVPPVFKTKQHSSLKLQLYFAVVARQESIQPTLVVASLTENEATLTENPAAPRIPIVALTSCVCAFGAAGLRRGLQGSFTRVWGIGLHMWLLIMMVRI